MIINMRRQELDRGEHEHGASPPSGVFFILSSMFESFHCRGLSPPWWGCLGSLCSSFYVSKNPLIGRPHPYPCFLSWKVISCGWKGYSFLCSWSKISLWPRLVLNSQPSPCLNFLNTRNIELCHLSWFLISQHWFFCHFLWLMVFSRSKSLLVASLGF